ncbi:MAG: hypothetical protein ACLTZY_09130 [Alistipes indistinctus]
MKTPNHRTLILAGGMLAFAGSLRAEDLPVEQRLDKIGNIMQSSAAAARTVARWEW